MSLARLDRIERTAAALLAALAVAYVATERSPAPWLFVWSQRWSVLLFVTIALAVLWLASYRWPAPRGVIAVRRVAVLSASSVLLMLVGVEVALRVADKPAFEELDNSGRHAPDPDVGHVYVPNHRQTLQTREYRVEWASNAQGVRAERDYGEKSPNVTRILCVGDSFTACDQVPYAQSWPAVLETRLNARLASTARRVEVVNAGFPGFSTANEAAWLAKFGATFAPDVVLVATTPNDLSENPFPLQYTVRDGRMVSARSTELDEARFEHRKQWWCLGGALERSILAQRVTASSAWASLLGRPPFHHIEAYEAPRSAKAERLYALASESMSAAAETARGLGARFGIVVIPYSRQLRDFGPGLDGGAYGAFWREFAKQRALDCADARTLFLADSGSEPLYWREDNHCTAAGYALVAQSADELLWSRSKELGWTP